MGVPRRPLQLSAAVLSLLLTLLFAPPVGAISDGTPDGGAHPYVGFVALYAGTPDDATFIRRCSGFLVSATVFVTAGHCGRPAADGTPVGFARVWPDEHVAGDPWTGVLDTTDGIVGTSFSLYPANDIGVVVLSAPINLAAYAVLPSVGAVDALANHATLDVVGYGASVRADVSGSPGGRWAGAADRLQTTSVFIPANNKKAADLLEHSNGSVGTGGSACFGDSGGPILAAGTSIVLAYNAYVDNLNCAGIADGVRLDVASRLEFVASFLP
jgi:hypothetical protein